MFTARLRSLVLVATATSLIPACRAADHPAPAEPAAPASAPATTNAETPAAAAPTLQTYDAPPGRADELASVLQRVLRNGENNPPLGKATALDGDRVLVMAPPSIHAGVQRLCLRMKESHAPAARTVQISYWVVRADAADTTDTSAVPEVAEALQEVADKTGPARFTLTERATLSSMLDARAKSTGRHAEFSQTATAREQGIVADIEIDLHASPEVYGRLETRIAIEPNQTVVVGQSGLENADDARLFFIVRAALVDAA